MPINKHVLLTGAGLTNNIGTPLAHEMWSYIFNNKSVQKHKSIVDSLYKIFIKKNDVKFFDYEAAYYEIVFGGMNGVEYNNDIKKAMKDAIKSAYGWIDEIVKDNENVDRHEQQNKWFKLIGNFREGDDESYIFTLNQDLFIERHVSIGFYIPGFPSDRDVHGFPKDTDVNNVFLLHRKELADKYYHSVPDENTIVKIENRTNKEYKNFYIKLHGSCNWYRKNKDYAMIIGYNKKQQSETEPLLHYYNSVFENVLCQENIELLIIGYGFGDANINDIIIKAVNEYGLKLHIVNPIQISLFSDFIHISPYDEQVKLKECLRKGLSGYYPYKLSEMFSNNTLFDRLIENYFGYI